MWELLSIKKKKISEVKTVSFWLEQVHLQVGLPYLVQVVKNLPAVNTGDSRDAGTTPGSRRCPAVENGYQLQHSCLENSRDWGAGQATVHGPNRVRHWATEQWRLSRVFFLLPLWGQCHTSAWKTRTQWVQRAPHDLDAYSFSVVSLQIKKASCSKKWKGFKLQREFWVMGSWAGGALEIWPNSIAKYLTSSSINWKL